MKHHPDYHLNVFINCPFDDQYFDLLKAIIFTICYFDFIPRISLENSDSGGQTEFKIKWDLPAGVYFIKVGDRLVPQRIIKQ